MLEDVWIRSFFFKLSGHQCDVVHITSGQSAGSSGYSSGYSKPITEYKSISELTKLGNDISGFRDWKVKKRDAVATIYRTDGLARIMDWIENPTQNLMGSETSDEMYKMHTQTGYMLTKDEWENGDSQ